MTLTPNTQITQENVGLLKAGDWLRVVDASGSDFAAGDLVQIEGWEDLPESRVPIINNLSWRLARFTYIGPDLGDGWIGWGGGPNPVPGMRVQVRFRKDEGRETYRFGQSEQYAVCWDKDGVGEDIIAFRPALSPPAADHIGDATEKVDWERVGPKLVEALAWYGDAGKNALISDAGKRARKALAALSKPNAPGAADHIADVGKMIAPSGPLDDSEMFASSTADGEGQ